MEDKKSNVDSNADENRDVKKSSSSFDQIRELLKFLACSIVDKPDQVSVEEVDDGSAKIFKLHVAEDDMGKVIGRQGKIAKAIRTVVKAAAIRADVRVSVDIE